MLRDCWCDMPSQLATGHVVLQLLTAYYSLSQQLWGAPWPPMEAHQRDAGHVQDARVRPQQLRQLRGDVRVHAVLGPLLNCRIHVEPGSCTPHTPPRATTCTSATTCTEEHLKLGKHEFPRHLEAPSANTQRCGHRITCSHLLWRSQETRLTQHAICGAQFGCCCIARHSSTATLLQSAEYQQCGRSAAIWWAGACLCRSPKTHLLPRCPTL